jgi:hypothetical protein
MLLLKYLRMFTVAGLVSGAKADDTRCSRMPLSSM